MSSVKKLPTRSEVPEEHKWDLSSLFPSDEAWEASFRDWESKVGGYERFAGKLGDGAAVVREFLDLDRDLDRQGERLGYYAHLKTAEDTANSTYQGMQARYIGVASRAAQLASFFRPELLSLPQQTLDGYLASPELEPYRLLLERIVRFKPHTLATSEERLLAMQMESADTASQAFRQLTDADMKFGTITDERGEELELSHASYQSCLYSPHREVRKAAFHQYYQEFQDHANTLAATLAGSVKQDVFYARARNYSSALEMALFPDQVPVSVYDNLIASVHRHLPAVYRYLDIRKRAMNLDEIHHYDTYVPILSDLEQEHSWDQAVDVVIQSLAPLGDEYCDALKTGLEGRWCDRYENKGKQSGAFSAGSFDGDPYILMNYQPRILNHVFTLAHEAGHSMHSYLSSKSQPYQYYDYTIFVAEVASTFNEELLGELLMKRASTDRERAYYINRQIDDIRGTIIRQTMFAEFERIIHALVEQNEPLTLDRLKEEYRTLLELYFGPNFVLDDELSLEGLRIPHFYRAFYVYKYATGMSAAIALSQRVLHGGQQELDDYLGFLKGGCSKDPLDLLRGAGVDMEQPGPVDTALARFSELVDELDKLV